jgi:hypothetical protein
MFDVLDDDERPRVGLLYAYWLAKFFGYRLDQKGYTPAGDGWAGPMTAGLAAEPYDDEVTAVRRRLLEARIGVLRDVWTATLALIQQARGSKAGRSADRPAWFLISDLSKGMYEDHFEPLAAVWHPAAGRRSTAARPGRQQVGTAVIPGTLAAKVAKLLARRRELLSLSVRVVSPSGQVITRRVAAPKGVANMTEATILSSLMGKKVR